jgi:Domain of unknown function (DUF4382)
MNLRLLARRSAQLFTAGAAIVLLLGGCGGSGSSAYLGGPSGAASGSSGTTSGTTSNSCGSGCGTAMTTVTDAPGDFLSYVVTLTSLKLVALDGSVVETLPAATSVDFSQLVDLSEIINAGQIPAGVYTGAQVTLNYANAQITADGGSGNPVALTPVDSTGATISGPLTLSVTLDNAHQLVITPGNTSRLALDFNLAASNVVNLTSDTVTVTPTLVATVMPTDTYPLHVRGALVSTNTGQDDFVLNVEPFFVQTPGAGQVTVTVSPTTTYQINGTAYTGAAGLTALAALPSGTMAAALGSLNTGTTPWTFTATSILAGTSLQSPVQDEISGTVISRTQNIVTVRGATWIMPGGAFGGFMRQDIPVTLGNGTTVTEEGGSGTYTIADVSVGQRIDAFGTGTQSAGALTALDASAGLARLDYTPLVATVTTLGTGTLTANVQDLGGLGISAFNFAGTGTSSADDAVGSAYVVNTGSVAQTGLAMGQPVQVIGMVTPYGSAPPDFTATTLVSYAQLNSGLLVNWGPSGSATALSGLTSSSTSLMLNLTNVGVLHLVQEGPIRIDLTTLSTATSIVPDPSPYVFSIGHAGPMRTENFNSFAAFVSQLSTELTGSTTVLVVAASGSFDATTNVFTAKTITVVLSK